jgi:hypothetical protein
MMNDIFDILKTKTVYPIIGTDVELSWLHQENNSKDTLLITVGDSWTWGDHLGSINWITQYDDPVRLQTIYGKKLSEKLDSDWILLARPGCSNYWMFEKLKFFSEQIAQLKSRYRRIIITVTLTEDFREFGYNDEEEYTVPYNSMISNSKDLFDFLAQAEDLLLEKFVNLLQGLEVEYYITRAFTDFWPKNKDSYKQQLLDKTWCDIFQNQVEFDRYYQVVPFIGQMAIGGIAKLIDSAGDRKDIFKNNFLDIETKITARYNFFAASWYNIKGSSCHPNAMGHEIFADYLYEKIKSK